MENKSANQTYLGITIGPVYKTIRHARKTRELWAASFALSQFMKNILVALKDEGVCLSPDISEGKLDRTFHGAGIWNDNCFFQIHDDKAEALQKNLQNILLDARTKTLKELLKPNKDGSAFEPLTNIAETLADCWHYHAVWLQRSGPEGPIIKTMGDLLHAPEQLAAFAPQHDNLLGTALSREETLRTLYQKGFSEQDINLIFSRYGKNKQRKRLPSLLEIATREIRKYESEGNAFYDETVTQAITEALKKRIQKEQQAEVVESELELDDHLPEDNFEDGKMVENLKAALSKLDLPFKKRWKYVAIVQSDGDNVGKTIGALQTRAEINTFSSELMAFSTEAAKIIAEFGGIPVFAGGDDLLFVAPLQNENDQTLFDLIDLLDAEFKKQAFLQSRGASLSFGASISYYKFPMSESLTESRELLQLAAKKLEYLPPGGDEQSTIAKNALAFRFITNSGQAFGATLRLNSPAYLKWRDLLKGQAALEEEIAFTSGLMHKLEPLRLLLEDACTHGQAEHFFNQHFNEAKGDREAFMKHAREFAEKAYAEYGALQFKSDRDAWRFYEKQLDEKLLNSLKTRASGADFKAVLEELQSHYKINLLYAALRTIHFLNADDHE